ncbi:MAG: amidohydrolase, partial [Sphingomonadales bacterium]
MTKKEIRAMAIRWTVAFGVFFAIIGSFQAWADKDKWDVNSPPGTIRDVSLDVTEGTWMSLDVSPDGKTIAFDMLGDIYTLPIVGGTAKSISKGIAWDIQPRFSPDGARIAFISDRAGGDNVWTMDADGDNPKQVTKEKFRLLNNPAWSPDGRFIAARKHFTSGRSLGAGEIWLYHISGGSGVQLNKRPNDQKELGEPMFTPDGKYVYFSQDVTPGKTFQYSKDSNTQLFQIKRIDLETGRIEIVVRGPGGAVRPTPSPDGKTLAFVRRIRARSALFLKDLESGKEWPIYKNLEMDMQETWAVHGLYPNMDWTPDNKSIVFWAGGKIQRIDVASGEVTDIPFHVKDKRQVIDAPRFDVAVAPDEFPALMIRDAEISPDGKSVVFEALGHIYLKELEGGKPKRLTTVEDHFELFPAFSPDGASVAYVAWDDEKLATVMRLDLASGTAKALTSEPGHYFEPQFTPDGSEVVFRKTRGAGLVSNMWSVETGLYRVSADGGEIKRITRVAAGNPHFTNEAGRIYYRHD